MIRRYLLFLFSWICFAKSLPVKFQTVQFLPPQATSFTTRSDQFITSGKIPKTSRRHIGIDDFFSVDLPPINTNLNSWSSSHDIFQHSFQTLNHFNGHITPDFSDGLAYPDPYLLTGIQAKRKASYLYSKELFFHNIPHVKALLHNQEERTRNGLAPHKLGSLRPSSPWHRFKGIEGFGGINSIFRF